VDSLAGTLETVWARLPEPAPPAGARTRLMELCARLPAALTRWIYLESHLGSDEPRLDLIVGVDRGEAGALLDGRVERALGAGAWGGSVWQGVRALCAQWLDPRSPLHDAVERMWLEFDLPPSPGGAVPAPGVFVDFADCADGGGAEARLALIHAALNPLLGAPLPEATARALLRCLRAVPPGARAGYVGLLLPRGSAAVRLCVIDAPRASLPAFLAAAGWPGSPAGLEATLRALAPSRQGCAHPDPGMVHLDVDGGVLPRIGLEYVFTRQGQARGTLGDLPFLDRLVDDGLCTPAQRRALASWPGATVEVFPHESWPSVAVRRVNHVKLVCGADGRPLAAKGYPYVHYAPRLHASSTAGTG